ncbi:hypothetical protein [Prochlorococcus marinus]|uniref:Uncharacterized protein n=1 Tax=Prochlorococcus marinus (strain MIT 9211) TaxID=93059 RepID=A9B9H3_PROM4|nr:hypothetical protein [Prochlorococcus marinus]ABX08028.1 conserved hypothetical protein [Prochlorococcus marinus str. MIT 9211]
MAKPMLPKSPSSRSRSHSSQSIENKVASKVRASRKRRRTSDNSDVLVSAVISSYLLTHLHHVLQKAEYGAMQEGRGAQAANFAQLRKVLCMDARSMQDASALGFVDGDCKKFSDSNFGSKVA